MCSSHGWKEVQFQIQSSPFLELIPLTMNIMSFLYNFGDFEPVI